MNLLRYRPASRDLHLPNGDVVKVEVSDDCHAQHVHDGEGRVHATARPDPIAIRVVADRNRRTGERRRRVLGVLRGDGGRTRGRKRFAREEAGRLWAPLPDEVTR